MSSSRDRHGKLTTHRSFNGHDNAPSENSVRRRQMPDTMDTASDLEIPTPPNAGLGPKC
jgi:hypothetical protein